MNTLLHKQSICNVRNLALMLMCSLIAFTTFSQEGSWGNTYIGNSGSATFFGAHNFSTGGSGSQPGLIKTARTAPLGILYYGPAATYTGADDANHVDGYVAKAGTAAFTFPIGNGTKLRTAGISAPASAGIFKAAYWFVNPNAATLPAGAPFPVANLGTGVTGVSTVEYWDIDGPSAIDLTLTWDAASNLNTLAGGVLSNLAIVGYNTTTSKWESLGGTATGTLTGTGSIVATGVTPDNYSAFTFGSLGIVTIPDLRPIVTMPNTTFNPSTLTRPLSIRLYNVGETTSFAEGLFTVYIYPPSSDFTFTLGPGQDWTIEYDAGGNYYTLTNTTAIIPYGTSGFETINLQLTIKPTTPKGKYSPSFEIGEGSGGEENSLNNQIDLECVVAN